VGSKGIAEMAGKRAVPVDPAARARVRPDAKPTVKRGKVVPGRKAALPIRAPRGRPKHVDGGAIRKNILDAAIKIFAERGLGGARIATISKMARSNDRMIYYYFGSKEKLYIAVLETLYRNMTDAERALALDLTDPMDALRRLARFTMQHYIDHPEMITVLNNENLHRGRHVSKAKSLKRLSSPALELLEKIVDRGIAEDVFRPDINAMQLYIAIMSLNYFYVSNRWTLTAFLGRDLMASDELKAWQDWVWQMIERSVTPRTAKR
jgi:TetR/AcrR family transcriptional regulator, upper aerobic nicotinate degradation pathway regulator